MVNNCGICKKTRAMLKRPKTAEMICRECFYNVFEEEIHQTIIQSNLFKKGEKVAIAASGGKGEDLVLEIVELIGHF